MITRAALLAAALRLLGYYNGNDYSAANPGGMSGVGGMATNWEPCIQDIGTVANGVGEVAGTIAAAQSTVGMVWDAATTVAAPGVGKLRATTATPAVGSYSLLVSATDSSGTDVSVMLAELGSSSSAVKARARLVQLGDASKYLDLLVAGVSGAGAYRTLAVTCIGGPGGFAAGDAVALGWVRTGDKGDTGAPGGSSFPAGTAATPGWAVTGDSNTGIAQIGGADTLSEVIGGQELVRYAPQIVYLNPARAVINPKLMFLGPNASEDYSCQRDGATGYLHFTGVQTAASGFSFRVNNGTERLRIPNAGPLLVDGVPIGSGEDTATSIAAASTVDIGSTTAKAIRITAGTGPIAAWGTAPAGAHRDITFAVPVTLTHNATSAILTGGGNITTVAGDTCRMESLGGSNWKMLSYQRASGMPLGTPTTQALSPSDKSSNATLSNFNATIVTADGGIASGRGIAAMTTPVYWEVVVGPIGTNVLPGIASAATALTDYITNSSTGYGYLSSGLKATNGGASGFGASFAPGDRLCFAYNPTTRNFWMGKVMSGSAVWGGSGDPAGGTNPAYTTPFGTPMYPAYSVNGSGASLTFAFGSGQQVATPPSGFAAFG